MIQKHWEEAATWNGLLLLNSLRFEKTHSLPPARQQIHGAFSQQSPLPLVPLPPCLCLREEQTFGSLRLVLCSPGYGTIAG